MARRKRPKPVSKYCKKCGKVGKVQYHHIIPWGIFKDNSEGIYLCDECHKDVHNYIGWQYMQSNNAQSKEFYRKKFWAWFMLMILLLILVFA
jgi:hypothetical protein